MEKKSNTNQHRGLFFKIGLAISLGLTLVAFEWSSSEPKSLVDLGTIMIEDEEMDLPPITKPPQVKPPQTTPIIEVVPDDEEIIEDTVVFKEFDLESEIKPVIEDDIVEVEAEPEEVVDEPLVIVEENASPKGGLSSFYKYVAKNLKYPRRAIQMGVEGKVYLQFIVNKDGSLVDIKVARGIGGGCDEEAIRVLKESPNWNPGKQRGRPVRQKMTFPIIFKLR